MTMIAMTSTVRSDRFGARGIALLLVLAVIAVASVFGMALLSSSALQAQVGGNAAQSTGADYLAESGLQAAMYFLQYPQYMPASWGTTSGYAIKATNQPIGAASLGTFDVQAVETDTLDEYDITAVGRSPTGGTSKTMTARVQVERAKIQGAGYFGGNITLPVRTTVSGHVQANGTVTNNTGSALVSSTSAPLTPTSYIAPSLSSVNFFGADGAGTYTTPDGQIGHAELLSAPPSGTLTAASNNPGKVFYYNGDLTLTSPLNLNGTLVVKNGSLTVRCSGNSIQAVSGYPAVVVERDVVMYRTNVSLHVKGVTYIGRNISWIGTLNTGSTLTIEGALVMPAGSLIGTPYTGGANVLTYASAYVDVPRLANALQPGKSVKIVTWNQ